MRLLPCRSSRFSGYEPFMNDEEVEFQQEQRHLIFSTIATTVLLLVAVACCLIAPDITALPSSSSSSDPKHTTPTLLSVVNHETGLYINALENPLYELLKGTGATVTILPDTDSQRRSWKIPPVLSVDRTVLGLRDPLQVSWTHGVPTFGYPPVQEHDVLALFCPASDDTITTTHVQEAATIAQIRATSAKHGGSTIQDEHADAWYLPEFPIFRATNCQFRLFAHDRQHHTLQLLATSPTIHMPMASKTPHSIHMSYSHVPSELVIEFVTGEPGSPVAMFGSQNATTTTTTRKVEGTSHTYTADAMCGAPANQQEVGKFQPPGYLHVVRLTGLELDTVYEYKVGLASGQGIVWSDVFSFRSAPAVGDPAPFTYIVYGDQGCPSVGWGNGGLWISAMTAREEGIRAVHHFGDLSYARGAAHIWDDWFDMLQAFSTKVPLHVGVGNHEYDHVSGGENGKDPSGVEEDHGFMPEWGNYFNDSGGECAVPTSQRFTMPTSTGSNGVFWYSHDYATVHTIMLSSEHNLTEGSTQHTWLRADLEAVNRTLTPWIVAELHRPMYEPESFWDNVAVGLGMQFEFEDLLFDHQVDLVLTGHYHAYFRSCDGLYRSICGHHGAPTHITVGSAGAHLDTNVTLYPQEWTAKFIPQEYGYGRITVVNATAMHWEFVRAGADNDTEAGAVLDEVWIVRERSI